MLLNFKSIFGLFKKKINYSQFISNYSVDLIDNIKPEIDNLVLDYVEEDDHNYKKQTLVLIYIIGWKSIQSSNLENDIKQRLSIELTKIFASILSEIDHAVITTGFSTRNIGQKIRYTNNPDGTYNVTTRKYKRVYTDYTVNSYDEMVALFNAGSEQAAKALAGFVFAKADNSIQKIGQITFSKNDDGSFNIRIGGKEIHERQHASVSDSDLEMVVGQIKAERIRGNMIRLQIDNANHLTSQITKYKIASSKNNEIDIAYASMYLQNISIKDPALLFSISLVIPEHLNTIIDYINQINNKYRFDFN